MRDVFPTLCELAEAETPSNLDGISVVPELIGEKQKERDHLYWEYHSPFQQAFRMGRWKVIRFGTEKPVELYDLKTDEAEQNDVAKDHPELVAQAIKIMNESRTPSRYWPARP